MVAEIGAAHKPVQGVGIGPMHEETVTRQRSGTMKLSDTNILGTQKQRSGTMKLSDTNMLGTQKQSSGTVKLSEINLGIQ